jgi:hypothetical protein
MIDPASHENWIDASPPRPFPRTGPPDDIDKALDKLADAIGRSEGGGRRSMARYLDQAPAASKIVKVLSHLPSSRLIAFLERHSGRDPAAASALLPALAASGAADRTARAQLFGRVTMAARMYALERACKAARAGARP